MSSEHHCYCCIDEEVQWHWTHGPLVHHLEEKINPQLEHPQEHSTPQKEIFPHMQPLTKSRLQYF